MPTEVLDKFIGQDDLRHQPDLSSTLWSGHRKRKQYLSPLGWADRAFCCSCSKPRGYVSQDSASIILCNECAERYPGGFPVPETTHVVIHCAFCNVKTAEIPKEMLSKIVYFCEPCDRKLSALAGEKTPGLVKVFT